VSEYLARVPAAPANSPLVCDSHPVALCSAASEYGRRFFSTEFKMKRKEKKREDKISLSLYLIKMIRYDLSLSGIQKTRRQKTQSSTRVASTGVRIRLSGPRKGANLPQGGLYIPRPGQYTTRVRQPPQPQPRHACPSHAPWPMRQAPGRPGPPPAPAVWALWADAGGGRRPATRPVWGVRSAAERSASTTPSSAQRRQRPRPQREHHTHRHTHDAT
jgi:hypothetical protein